MAETIKRIDIKEFREFGFLQEANRRFFHPLGLALEVVIDDDGTERLGGVQDYRDDAEGMAFAEGSTTHEKFNRVADLRDSKKKARQLLFNGHHIQPTDDCPSSDTVAETLAI